MSVVLIVAAYGYHVYRIDQDRDKRIEAEQIRRNTERIRLPKAISDDRFRVKNDQSKINMLQAEGRDTRAAKALLHSDPVQLEVDERASSRMARRTVVLANSNRKGKSLPTTLGSSLRQVFGRS